MSGGGGGGGDDIHACKEQCKSFKNLKRLDSKFGSGRPWGVIAPFAPPLP